MVCNHCMCHNLGGNKHSFVKVINTFWQVFFLCHVPHETWLPVPLRVFIFHFRASNKKKLPSQFNEIAQSRLPQHILTGSRLRVRRKKNCCAIEITSNWFGWAFVEIPIECSILYLSHLIWLQSYFRMNIWIIYGVNSFSQSQQEYRIWWAIKNKRRVASNLKINPNSFSQNVFNKWTVEQK